MLAVLKRHWLAIVIWLLVGLPLATFVLANIVLLAYLFWPNKYDGMDFHYFQPLHSHAIVMAHGVNDTPATWVEPLMARYREQSTASDLFAVDWSAYAGNPLRCAIDGGRIGRRIGRQLVANGRLHSVQLIGHSCGAFVIYNLCREIKALNRAIQVQTTYLDPVSIYGPWFDYGVDHFGDCADYSDAYIDTGDHIAGSNQLLAFTHTYDVTAVRERYHVDIHPHLWPTLYYQQLLTNGRPLTLQNTPDLNQRKPRGVLEILVQ